MTIAQAPTKWFHKRNVLLNNTCKKGFCCAGIFCVCQQLLSIVLAGGSGIASDSATVAVFIHMYVSIYVVS